jgi:hypothetical protein
MHYTVKRTGAPPPMDGRWDATAWGHAETLEISHFRPESNAHRPRTEARLLYDDDAVYGFFRVADRYVRCVNTAYQSGVCQDSCVEWFVCPAAPGYFNFEINCGGTLHASYLEDPTRTPKGFRKFTFLDAAAGGEIRIRHSLPSVVDPELTEPVEWTIQFAVPLAVLRRYAGPVRAEPGVRWRGNFYKCGDKTSHPHWAAWSPVAELNFHRPADFGEIEFA